MRHNLVLSVLMLFSSYACSAATPSPIPGERNLPTETDLPLTGTSTFPAVTGTASVIPSPQEAATATSTEAVAPSETPLALPPSTAIPRVESLKATVSADLLSCRYGPGPEYLYLFAFRRTANIEIIGRVDAENWNWVLVENQVPCWVHANFLDIQGDIRSLPVVYPGIAKLPITPYYPPSAVLSAQRNPQTNEITLSWMEVPVNLGDYEDESMQTYIIELWRCQDGQLIFDPLATRFAFISFIDDPGCSEPSYGRVWVQEKHGYAGPAEIPWPPYFMP